MNKLIIPIIIGALVLATGSWFLVRDSGENTLVAHFPRTVSVYKGSEVKILGVSVGKVTDVKPNGTDVAVTMSYPDNVKIPADAKAAIVAPSIVGDRYIQMTPAYTSGPTMKDGAVLSTKRTAVPVELDQIYSSLDNLTVALGPNGANKNGALTDLLQQTAKNLGGQGKKLNTTITDLGKLTKTLDDNKDQFFNSADQLEGFVNTLAKNDQTVRDFTQSLAKVSNMLADERSDLATAMRQLSKALAKVTEFVRTNKDVLKKDIDGANKIGKVLVRQRTALKEILRTAPLALNNLAFAYNPDTGTLDTNANLTMIANQIVSNPAKFLCGLVAEAADSGSLCNSIKGSLNRSGAMGAGGGSSYGHPYDPTLGGLVEVKK